MLNEFLILATAHLFAVASPGADFAIVLKNTLVSGRKAGTYTAIGVGLGILIHVVYTLLGVAIVLSQSPFLFEIVKYIGAVYLVWLAFHCFNSHPREPQTESQENLHQIPNFRAIKQGLLVNVLNPKVTFFFIALFTSIVSHDTPISVQIFYGLWLSFYTFLWFWLVAWWFSRAVVLVWYQKYRHIIDWLMGIVLVIIAIRLAF